MYADDLILLSASILDLQCMLDICSNIGISIGIKFNNKKSHCICIGSPPMSGLPTMLIGAEMIGWVDQIKYLGIWINSHKCFQVDVRESRRKFFMSMNCILSKTRFTCDLVKLRLMESFCLTSLTYGIECGIFDKYQLQSLNCCWNSVFRKIFGYFTWESVSNLICSLNKLNFIYTENIRRVLFIRKILTCRDLNNSTLSKITECYIHRAEFQNVLLKCNLDLSWPVSKLINKVHKTFKDSCV
jgi:hypothetical protein